MLCTHTLPAKIDRRIETMMQRYEDSTISLIDYLSVLSYLICASRIGHIIIVKIKRFGYVGKVTQNVGKVRRT